MLHEGSPAIRNVLTSLETALSEEGLSVLNLVLGFISRNIRAMIGEALEEEGLEEITVGFFPEFITAIIAAVEELAEILGALALL